MKNWINTRTLYALLGGSMLLQLGGCNVDGLMQNIWRGFGQSIGAIPGTTIGNLLAATLGLQ